MYLNSVSRPDKSIQKNIQQQIGSKELHAIVSNIKHKTEQRDLINTTKYSSLYICVDYS